MQMAPKESAFRVFCPAKVRLSILIAAVACSGQDLPTETGPEAAGYKNNSSVSAPVDTALRYIVRLKDRPGNVADRASEIVRPLGGNVSRVFERVFQGFVAQGLTPAAADRLARNPLVEYVELDAISYPTDVQTLTLPEQWGLDRIDQHPTPLDNQYAYTYTAAGVHIYIMDSGIRGDHIEFAGRMGNGVCTVSLPWWMPPCFSTSDDLGHGTSVASEAAGTLAGVAKGATIHSVRIDDGTAGAAN